MGVLDNLRKRHQVQPEEMSLTDFLQKCKDEPDTYISPAERMLKAIGEPTTIDTAKDPRLGRIHFNKVIRIYPAFKEFYGMEDTIENIVSYFKHSAQGLEEKKQILYLLGPVGGGKSSLAERLKQLMTETEIYVLKGSPINESPLGLFSSPEDRASLEDEYGIPSRYVPAIMSPWAAKRLAECGGNLESFTVVKLRCSIVDQIGVAKVEPGDDNNMDISSLVGKVDIRKLGEFAQNDADAYNYSGGLCKANQGIMEFVEMFKAPIKLLHPLLTATQESNYNGTEAISAIPFNGIILAHSNESEWQQFSNDKKNEAFLDRVYIVRVPYCLRKDEEVEIYKKLLRNSSLSKAPVAPKTLETMSEFSIMTRLKTPENSKLFSKMKVYNGESLKEKDPNSKSLQEYTDDAGVNEGMNGISTRFAFKVLSKVFNYDKEEIAANPIHLFYVLEQEIIKNQFNKDLEEHYLAIVKDVLAAQYKEFIEEEIQKAYIDSYSAFGQNIFEKYITYADHWLQDQDYRDSQTGEQFDRALLNSELEKIEKPAGIVNPKDFRSEIVNFYFRSKAANKETKWDSYEKMKNVIEKKLMTKTEDLLPVISFGPKVNAEEEEKHAGFIGRMKERGYTDRQIQLICDWYLRVRRNL